MNKIQYKVLWINVVAKVRIIALKRVFLILLRMSIEIKNAAMQIITEWKKYPLMLTMSHKSPAPSPKNKLTVSLSNIAIETTTGMISIAFEENICAKAPGVFCKTAARTTIRARSPRFI